MVCMMCVCICELYKGSGGCERALFGGEVVGKNYGVEQSGGR